MDIIQSLLDNDLYKLSMLQAVLHNRPTARVEYAFKCRNQGVDLASHLAEIGAEIGALNGLRLSDAEAEWLSKIDWFKPDFISFLRRFSLDTKFVRVKTTDVPGEIDIRIAGPWVETILFEVPILAIVNEVYFRNKCRNGDVSIAAAIEGGRQVLGENIALVKKAMPTNSEGAPFSFTDFGTRRRFSAAWQDEVVKRLADELPKEFVGTSNMALAMKYGLKPIGTIAHEFIMAFQAFVRVRDSQKAALECWSQEFRGELGIALSDTLGIDAFLRDFDAYFAKLFDGVRHDSSDPYQWTEKVIAHYNKLRIDPMTKLAVYSDGLTMQKAIDLWQKFRGRIKTGFGIGTKLTNAIPGLTPLQIVIKMVRCDGQPVAKISDEPGKAMCEDRNYLAYLMQQFGIGQEAA